MKEEIKRDNEDVQTRLPIMETKMDTNMIAEMGTNSKILNREMYAVMERTITQAQELEKVIKEQSSRQLPSDIKNDDIRESDISLNLEDELSSLTLDEDKIIMKCDKMPLVLEAELQVPSLIEKNDLSITEDLSLKEKQVEKKHSELIVENVLVEVEDFNFHINSLTFGTRGNRQVSDLERPSFATSQVWIDAEHGERTLLVGEMKMKFDHH